MENTLKQNTTERWFHVGILLCFISGLFPLGVGFVLFMPLLFSYIDASSLPSFMAHWWGADYTLNLFTNPSQYAAQILILHIAVANLLGNGLATCFVTLTGLKNRKKWAWFGILINFGLVALNDLFALLYAKQFPIPLFPLALISVGLILTGRVIFKRL